MGEDERLAYTLAMGGTVHSAAAMVGLCAACVVRRLADSGVGVLVMQMEMQGAGGAELRVASHERCSTSDVWY